MNYFNKIFTTLVFFSILTQIARAETPEEIQKKITEKNTAIVQLEAEIKGYQLTIEDIGKEKNSLSKTIKSLDVSKKKLQTDTKITENKIATKNLEVKNLSLEIGEKNERIQTSRSVISKSFLSIYQANSATILESILGRESFSDLWRTSDELNVLQGEMQDKIKDLRNIKTSLEVNKKLTEKKKTELVGLTNDLKNQTKIIVQTANEKNNILEETKNTESNYSKILVAKLAQKDEFEREVSNLESELRINIDPSTVPSARTGVIGYPLASKRVTQYFGNTLFSARNPQVYKGSKGEHNGIDFAASIGTPVFASADGIVTNVINTKSKLRCGYGNWISVRHPNGLTTLYAHLSLNTVAVGSSVSAGETIGYSGNTGYTTGPHLHFGLYVTKGFQVTKSVSCPGITIPYASLNAYLNPFSYL